KEDLAVDRPLACHQQRPRSEPDRAYDGQGLPAPGSPRASALPARCPRVLATHPRLAERLVDEDQSLRVQRRDVRAELSTAPPVLRRVALARHERSLFFEYPSLVSARSTAERLVVIDARDVSASVSSATVASGIRVTIALSNCATRS